MNREQRKRRSEQYRKHDNLKDLVLRHSLRDVFREEIEYSLLPGQAALRQ